MVVLKIMRYISPFPWGSIKAEAGRRTRSIEKLLQHIWSAQQTSPCAVTVGGHVLWSPIRISKNGEMRHRNAQEDWSHLQLAWLASRLPASRHISLHQDITDLIRNAIADKTEPVDLLWDNRFRFRFKVSRLDPTYVDSIVKEGARVAIRPFGPYSIPEVTISSKENTKTFDSLVGNSSFACAQFIRTLN